MSSGLPAAVFEALRTLSTAAVCNAIESAAVRLRNEGYMDRTITPRTAAAPLLGYALTLQMRSDAPPATGSSYADRSDWWDAFAAPPFPKIIVIEDVGRTPAVGAVAGETHMQVFKSLGAAGLITNGAVRDTRALHALGLPVYAAGVVPAHGYAHIVGVGMPVTIGCLAVETGDLLHGDADGVTKIPLHLAADLPRLAQSLAAEEDRILALCRGPGFSPERLRAALAAHDHLQRRN